MACLDLTLGCDLLLDGQHEFGLSGQVLAASLLVLQRYGQAAREVVHAADDRRVGVRLSIPTVRCENLLFIQPDIGKHTPQF